MYMGPLLQDEQYMYVMSQTYTYTHTQSIKKAGLFLENVFFPQKIWWIYEARILFRITDQHPHIRLTKSNQQLNKSNIVGI